MGLRLHRIGAGIGVLVPIDFDDRIDVDWRSTLRDVAGVAVLADVSRMETDCFSLVSCSVHAVQ